VLPHNKKLKVYSRELRKNMTEAEKLLWSRIRKKQLKNCQFYRQKIIGNYIVDFHCPKSNLIIELDGGQHYSDEGMKKDKCRDDYMKNLGLRVLRFSDKDVFGNLNGILEKIWEKLNPPNPLLKRGNNIKVFIVSKKRC
jgi:very-short-patch-repair endonuclease